jgi:hypothetical protein
MMQVPHATLLGILLFSLTARAELPAPPTQWLDWPMSWTPTAPGVMSATDLLDKPAGKDGPIIVRDGHFYSGAKRIRFWGVNFAFSACFPLHEQADAVAQRLANYGINAVRIHHADMMTFPGGIWADGKCETFSPEALDRLDYLIAALKKQGIYSDLNLHVSRTWSKSHQWENADKLPESFDKLIDIFHPDLIAANKQYARDLLGHVNAYTKVRYADEPAICFVEINNEDTLFLWGGEQALARLPEPYAGMLQKLWNEWLTQKYGAREKLREAWAVGEMPLGENLLRGDFKKDWHTEQHETAKLTATVEKLPNETPAVNLAVTHVDGTDWHLQFNQGGLKLAKGKYYTVTFSAKAEKPTSISVGVAQAHAPWQNLGLSSTAKLESTDEEFSFGFTTSTDDDNARISFSLGHDVNAITLAKIELREGGRLGLRANEDLAKSSVTTLHAGTPARSADWFDFLQQTDERYFTGMLEFLKKEIGVKCPITGSIGLGPLGTLSQSKMDFVDAHAYWDHPQFPHRSWDMKDWTIKNEPMVDHPEGATLWNLAATRVEGKPFTVTEYNHAAPNEWQAECVPMIASYAALQDWDGVFLFAYSHDAKYDKGKMASFFDVEGNPPKMPLMPSAARIFLGQAVKPSHAAIPLFANRDEMLRTGSRFYYQIWPWAMDKGLRWQTALHQRVVTVFSPSTAYLGLLKDDARINWTANGSATGQFILRDDHAAVFVGFPAGKPIELGPLTIDRVNAPFCSLMLLPADASQTLSNADRLLLTIVGRAENTGMKWDPKRHSVSDQWGSAPPRVEKITGDARITDPFRHIYVLTSTGERQQEVPTSSGDNGVTFKLGEPATITYEITK